MKELIELFRKLSPEAKSAIVLAMTIVAATVDNKGK